MSNNLKPHLITLRVDLTILYKFHFEFVWKEILFLKLRKAPISLDFLLLPTNISNVENNNEKFDAKSDVNKITPTAWVSSG